MIYKNLSIRYKLFLTFAVVSILVFALSFTLLYFQVRNHLESQIKSELGKSNQTITDMVEVTATVSIKNHLRAIAEKNLEIITHLHQAFLEDRLTEAQAKNQAIQILLSQTVGETGYIYCIDSLGIVRVHPRKEVREKSVASRGFVQNQIKRKQGYLEYNWKNPGEKNEKPKALFMSYFEPWDWIISVSSYKSEFSQLVSIDDLKDRVLGLTVGRTGYSFIVDIRNSFLCILALAIFSIGLASMIVSTSITGPLTQFIHRFEKGAQGDLSSRIDQDWIDKDWQNENIQDEGRQDEIGKLSASFNRFMDRLDAYRRDINSEIKSRKKTEQELQTLKNYLINIIDSMPSILVGVNRHLKVSLWNEKAAQETEIALAHSLGVPVIKLLPRIKEHLPLLEESLRTRQIRQILKHPYTSANGDVRYETLTIFPLSETVGQGAVIRIDDVTETLRLEETLIQNEKMLSVGGLAAGMAHEINNPLAGVIQNAGLLNNRLQDAGMPANIQAAQKAGTTMETIHNYMDSREIFQIITAIIHSGSRMAEIVNNMLSFARKGGDAFSTHDPIHLMDRILDIAATDYDLKKQYDFKSILIEKVYEPDLPFLPCDGGKIQQVLLNILNNGAQAMAENPVEKQSKFIIRLSREPKTEMIRMEIEDNGPGIAPDVEKRIFEPFFTTKPVGIGTGLGLSVSYFIITENHRGTLHVTSRPGQGSCFIIRLPLSKN